MRILHHDISRRNRPISRRFRDSTTRRSRRHRRSSRPTCLVNSSDRRPFIIMAASSHPSRATWVRISFLSLALRCVCHHSANNLYNIPSFCCRHRPSVAVLVDATEIELIGATAIAVVVDGQRHRCAGAQFGAAQQRSSVVVDVHASG